MILFNFGLCNPISYSSYDNSVNIKFKLICNENSMKKNSDSLNLEYKNFANLVSINNHSPVNKINIEILRRRKKADLIKRNFWQKLVNQYWQETIFISSSNSVLENYSNKLKSSGLSVYQGSDYKKFLLQFSKDLLDRKVRLNLRGYNNEKILDVENRKNVYIRYKWLKPLNFNILLLKKESSELEN